LLIRYGLSSLDERRRRIRYDRQAISKFDVLIADDVGEKMT
jgi:hypothetical protein